MLKLTLAKVTSEKLLNPTATVVSFPTWYFTWCITSFCLVFKGTVYPGLPPTSLARPSCDAFCRFLLLGTPISLYLLSLVCCHGSSYTLFVDDSQVSGLQCRPLLPMFTSSSSDLGFNPNSATHFRQFI